MPRHTRVTNSKVTAAPFHLDNNVSFVNALVFRSVVYIGSVIV